ncbi:MAG: NADH-quinone oxidoreductase subunit K [Chloroflexi bacterium]|nr:NADH-quinone oxidoreductase subunit K [Chloroflexota bacterium]
MSLLMAATIGVLVAVAVLQLLQRNAVRMVIGLYLFWNAANLLIIAVSRTRGVRAPFVGGDAAPLADPLVQALVLTAIVITFGFTAFLVTLTFWLVARGNSIDVTDFTEGRA